MRMFAFPAVILSVLVAGPVFAQQATPLTPQGVPPGADPQTGARPGNDVGSGMSMPMGSTASNINAQTTRSPIAPNLPQPAPGSDGSVTQYLHDAQGSLAAGRTGQAQQALEMAQTRLLDRSVPALQTDRPSESPAVQSIRLALQALASGDRSSASQLTGQAIQQVGTATR